MRKSNLRQPLLVPYHCSITKREEWVWDFPPETIVLPLFLNYLKRIQPRLQCIQYLTRLNDCFLLWTQSTCKSHFKVNLYYNSSIINSLGSPTQNALIWEWKCLLSSLMDWVKIQAIIEVSAACWLLVCPFCCVDTLYLLNPGSLLMTNQDISHVPKNGKQDFPQLKFTGREHKAFREKEKEDPPPPRKFSDIHGWK